MKNKKFVVRLITAISVASVVLSSLWFASPVGAFTISFPSLPSSGTIGSTYSFSIQTTINDPEQIPIQTINLDIYNSASPTTYKASCTNLPLSATTKSYTSTETGGGAVTVTATVSGWSYGFGYGYGVWEGTPYYFGNGNGYGAGVGTASITYSITWTSPAGWPSGGYKAAVKLTANTTTFTKTSSEFTLSTPSPAGEPSPPEPPGTTTVTTVVTSQGTFTQPVTASSVDKQVNVTINQNTKGLTKEGTPLREITVVPIPTPPPPPSQSNIIGLTYEFGPEGATFDKPVTLTFTYNASQIPEGVDEKNLVLALWDNATGKWVTLVSTVDPVNNTITVQVTHFSKYAILAYTRPAAFTAASLSISPTEVSVGQSVTIRSKITNTGDFIGMYPATLKINNVVIETKTIIVAAHESQTVTFTISKDAAGTYTVSLDSQSGTFTVRAPVLPSTPAAFTTGSLSISPSEANVGQSVTISTLVTNTGGLSGSYKATLKVDNVVVETKDVTLDGGASQTVTFTTSKDAAGTYTVSIDSLSGTFTVKAAEVPPKPVPWALIGGIIAAVIVIAVVVWFIIRRRSAWA